MNFNQFGLRNELLKAVEALGFTQASPIQQQTIPLLINEITDIIALAQTGTGKTAAFGLPLLHRLDEEDRNTQALILSPTRELCMQIKEEMDKYSRFMDNVHIEAVYGGAPITHQIKAIRQGAQIIVATPGRLIDLMNRRVIKLQNVTTVVLDEADEMLNMGFREDIESVLEAATSREEAWLFSATMNNDVRRIAKRFMNEPQEVAVAKENIGNENIEHQYFAVQNKDRYEALRRLLDITPDIYGIIFTRTKQDAHDVSEKLVKDGYKVSALHGDLDQNMRTKVMGKFKNKQLQVLVATDVAARGIDVNDITHVINYELPDDPEVYTHRSGRTARAGKKGICISLVTAREISKIRRIERIVNSKFEKQTIPAGKEIIEYRLRGFIEQIEAVNPDASFEKKYQHIIHEGLEHLSKDELINKLLWLQLSPTIDAYHNSHDLNVSVKEGNKASTAADGTARLFINLGKKDGLTNKKLADFIADSIDFEYKAIDKVTVTELSSYFNVPADMVDYIMEHLPRQKFNGRKIRVDEADAKPTGRNRGGRSDRSDRNDRNERSGRGDRRDRSDRREDRPKKERGFYSDNKKDFGGKRRGDDFGKSFKNADSKDKKRKAER